MSAAVEHAIAQIRDRVRIWFVELRAKHPQKHFHAVAFGFRDDFVGMSLNATSLDLQSSWNDTFWPHFTPFFDAWEAIPVESEDQTIQRYRAKCLLATIEALRALGEEGLWGTGTDQVLVYLSMWDGFARRWLWSESARRIQPA